MRNLISRTSFVALAAVCVLAPMQARADRGALIVEAGGALALTRADPSVGDGARVDGTLAGAAMSLRYAVTNRFELHGAGQWNAPSPFVSRPFTIRTAAGTFEGDLRRDLSRFGAGVGARYVVAGRVWRFPVGGEVGWLRTAERKQTVVPRPGGESFVPFELGDHVSDRAYVAPFAGVEWQATDHLSVSVLPRLEVPLGGGSPALVAPLLVGWSWFLM